MSLTVNNFATMAQQSGNMTMQGEALVHGQGGTWIRSALNIGNSRADNTATLQAFSQAIHNDPRYAQVHEQAQAMLGTISSKHPLSAAQVKNVLGNLDKAAANVVAQNQGQSYTLIMQQVASEKLQNTLTECCRNLGMEPPALTDNQKSLLAKTVSEHLLTACGDFSTPPDPADLRQIGHDICQDMARSLQHIDNSTLNNNIKSILRDSICNGTVMNSSESVQANITVRETRLSNDTMAANMVAENGPLHTCLEEQLNTVGLADKMPDGSALRELREGVSNAIIKVGRQGQHLVTPEQAQGIVQAKVAEYQQAMQTAAHLPNPAEGAFVQGYLQHTNGSMPAAFIQSTVAHSQGMDVGKLAQPQAFASPLQMMNYFLSLATNANHYQEIPENMRPEGNLGRQNYLDIQLGCALARANFSPDQMRVFYDQLCQGAGKELHTLIDSSAPSAQRTTVLSFMEILQHRAGTLLELSPDTIANDFQAPFRPVVNLGAGTGFTPVANPEMKLEQAARPLADNLKTMVLIEATKAFRHGDPPIFEKDITRMLNIQLGGVKLLNIANRAEIQLPEGMPDTLENRAKQIITLGYDAFTAFVTNTPEATFATALPEIQNQVRVLTSLLNQETEKPAQSAVGQSLITDFGTQVGVMYANDGQRNFQVDRMPDGAISICYSGTMSVNYTFNVDIPSPSPMEQAQSKHSTSLSFMIPQDQLTQIGQQDWEALANMGYDKLSHLKPNEIPDGFALDFKEFQLSGSMSLVSRQAH